MHEAHLWLIKTTIFTSFLPQGLREKIAEIIQTHVFGNLNTGYYLFLIFHFVDVLRMAPFCIRFQSDTEQNAAAKTFEVSTYIAHTYKSVRIIIATVRTMTWYVDTHRQDPR